MKRLKYILLLTLLSGCSLNQKQTQVPPVKEVAVKAPVSRELINKESEAKVKPSNVIVIVADQMRRTSLAVWNDAKYQGKLNGVSDQGFLSVLADGQPGQLQMVVTRLNARATALLRLK